LGLGAYEPPPTPVEENVDELRARLTELQQRIEKLSNKAPDKDTSSGGA